MAKIFSFNEKLNGSYIDSVSGVAKKAASNAFVRVVSCRVTMVKVTALSVGFDVLAVSTSALIIKTAEPNDIDAIKKTRIAILFIFIL